jgi:hypothetical protein
VTIGPEADGADTSAWRIRDVALLPAVGRKPGRRLDLHLMQKRL